MKETVVVFATDKNYMYYTGVTLQSLIDHTSQENKYLIVILHEDLSPDEQQFFYSLTDQKNNISLKLVDMSDWINKIGRENFFTGGRYPIAAYYRLFLPEILSDIDKVVYLDSDMLVRADIAKLANTDLHGYALGAVKDVFSVRFPHTAAQIDKYLYCRRNLHLETGRYYLNSGMLVLDLEYLRKMNFRQHVLKCLATGISFSYVDQDIFNMIFQDQYCEIDPCWNTIVQHYSKYDACCIMHFASLAPWNSLIKPYSDLWHNYAKTLPFYQTMMEHAVTARQKYLDELEVRYYDVINSTNWKLTYPLRAMIIYICALLRFIRK